MRKMIFFYLTIIIFVFFNGNAQGSYFHITEQVNDKYTYVDVLKNNERIAKKGYKSGTKNKKIGDSYYRKADYNKSAHWYFELFTINTDIKS